MLSRKDLCGAVLAFVGMGNGVHGYSISYRYFASELNHENKTQNDNFQTTTCLAFVPKMAKCCCASVSASIGKNIAVNIDVL